MSLSTDSRNMRATTRRYMLGFIALLFFLQLFMVLPVGAVSANEWRAGNIIDDSVFYNKNAMSVYEIQNFLNSKVPACDTTGSGAYGNITRAQYSTGKGYPPPYICLKDYWENPTTKANNLHNGGSPGAPKPAGARSAAEIIWDVSQQYSISPKVMLVLLHKESDRLLIDNWPWAVQYKAAMGYGCPDTGANYSANCSSQYYGFYNQMSSAAKQMRRYATYPQEYRYKAGQNNTIKYAPNPECGSSTVYIENQATASLYNYTPYQPNQAALNAGYGEASCGAYGNRNFWKLFSDWFGSVRSNCTYPYTDGSYIFRLFQPNRNNYLLTKDPAEVCAASSRYGFVYDGVIAYENPNHAPIYRLSNNGNYLYTASTTERDNAVSRYGFRYEGVAFQGSAAGGPGLLPIHRLQYNKTGGFGYTPSSAEKDHLRSVLNFSYDGITFFLPNSTGNSLQNTYRLAHPVGGYLYTISTAERSSAVTSYHYRDEGVGFKTRGGYTADDLPVYRLAATRGYLYTTSLDERKFAISHGYRDEGITYFAYPHNNLGASKQIFRLAHPNGTYFYTSGVAERDSAVRNYGYRYEGVGFRIP